MRITFTEATDGVHDVTVDGGLNDFVGAITLSCLCADHPTLTLSHDSTLITTCPACQRRYRFKGGTYQSVS
jgi:hypothetical protein